MTPETRARLERLLEAARALADPRSLPGQEARARLLGSTGLSREGIELAFEQSLELRPSQIELEALAESVPAAPRVHVILSSTVFTAVHRALALALSASPSVFVKPSRREPEMAELLRERAPGLFALVGGIAPASGDAVFVYGGAETLARVRASLPSGVWLHAHGPGFGAIALHGDVASDAVGVAEAIAHDVALFDQRGCLSPRLVLVEAERATALELAAHVAAALDAIAQRVPLGRLSPSEAADARAFRDLFAVAGDVLPAGPGWVGVAERDAPPVLAPVGRNLLLVPVSDAAARVRAVAPHVTTFAALGPAPFTARFAAALPRARRSALGALQSPPFDGPVDRRTQPELGIAPNG